MSKIQREYIKIPGIKNKYWCATSEVIKLERRLEDAEREIERLTKENCKLAKQLDDERLAWKPEVS